MLGTPSPHYLGVSVDRLRHFLPPPYAFQAPKLLSPPSSMSTVRASTLQPPLSPRTANAPINTGSDAIPIGISRRRSGSDLRPFPTRLNSAELSTPTPAWPSIMSSSSSSSASSSSLASSSIPSSSSSSSSTPPSSSSKQPPTPSLTFHPSFQPPYPPGPLFPGLGLNPMTSTFALKMGMLTSPHHTLENNNNNKHINNNNNTNISNAPLDHDVTKLPSSAVTKIHKHHPYLPHIGHLPTTLSHRKSTPPPPSSSSLSSPPSSSSSSTPSSSSSTPPSLHPSYNNTLFPFPKLFTSFLTPEEQQQQQQQYLTMLSLQQQAATTSPPSSTTSKEPPPFHGLKPGPASSAFATRNYLELAMLVCNTFRGKLFPCPHCRYVTDRRNNLKRHVATMHQACDKQLECCGVTFATKASLREHIAIFHHNGYSCTFCGRRFCRKALLKRHLSVHNGQKDYTCPSCDYATSHKSNLERHKRIHARLPENGESPLYPDASLDDDVTNEDVDFKDGNLLNMTSSPSHEFSPATMASLPYYYNQLYRSFPRHQPNTSHFLSPKDSGDMPSHAMASVHNHFLHNPYYFKDRTGRGPTDHVTDLSMTSSQHGEGQGDEDESDSDIDIDSVDDNDNDILDKSTDDVTGDTNPPPQSETLRPLEIEDDDDDDGDDDGDNNNDDENDNDDRPLNLVKARQQNE